MPPDEKVIPPRDVAGKFVPKRPLEFTWPHFWLEVAEIAVGVVVAQGAWEIGVLIFKLG